MFLISFVDKVVNSGNLIVLIIINTLLGIVGLESELLNHLKDFGLCRDRILANNQALILANGLVLLKPTMLADVFCCESSVRVCIQNLRENVSSIL